ncbi:MAG: Inner rane component of cytoplasmic domain [Myxococcaceae bacterium]|nr:Inner rane component of cytoplasmic domain [Myxococcaceae bacterium]
MKRAWLEIDNAKTGRADRFCLDGFARVVIGSATFATLRLTTHGAYSPQHFALSRLEGRWQVADLHSATGLFMNQARMRTARWLDSGDKFYVMPQEQFRFTEEPVDPRWEAHAARLAHGDDSEGAWLVFADALQELGDETGQRMVAAGEDPALPLGFLERMRGDGTVTFTCRFGFLRTLTLRNVGLARELNAEVIDAVLAQPVARLLRHLEVDVPSFEDVPLETLAAAIVRAAPPSLRVVRLLGVFGAPPRGLFPPALQVEWAPI